MNINTIDVGNDFYHRLANRDEKQGDGKHTAVDFRKKYLGFLGNKEAWNSSETAIILDFKNVKKIGPSFANEAFAFFTEFAKPEKILKKIEIKNATNIHMRIIKQELDTAYNETI